MSLMPKKSGKRRIPAQNSMVMIRHRINLFFVIGWQTKTTTAILIPPPISRLRVDTSNGDRAKIGLSICTTMTPPTKRAAQGRDIFNTFLKNPVVVTASCCSNVRKKLGIPIAVAPIRLS